MSGPDLNTPVNRAQGAWMDHMDGRPTGQRCEQCCDAVSPSKGCPEGRRLYAAMRDAWKDEKPQADE